MSKPPGPKGNWVSGNLPEYRKNRLACLMRWAGEYGPIFCVRLGPRTIYALNDPEFIEYVLVGNNRNFIKSRFLRSNRLLLGNGLLTSEGDFWLRQRRLAQPAFHRQRISAYGKTMVDFTLRMLQKWQNGESHDIHKDMMRLTLEIVAKTLFDADVNEGADEVGHALEIAMEQHTARINRLFPLPEFLPTPGNLRFRKSVRRVDSIIHEIIRRRRVTAEDPCDLLSMLLHARDEDGSRMTDQQLRDEAVTLFLAGHETTANALAWTWFLLATNPDAETMLHQELASVLMGRAPEVEDLARLRYAEMIILEAMRLYPPAWILGRESVAACEIGGYPIPPGATVIASTYVMHRNPRYFPEPERFLPERWENDFVKTIPKYAYFPFGGGPRLCIGNSFAMMETVLLLTTIAQQFQLGLLPAQEIVPAPSITLRPKYGIHITLKKREAAAV